ncbi:DUF6034 family protein [Christensenella hongkongensis]|uniref:Uncharacterized protein n=1 Tax=Christensenella hongkongensis TaxID=270498 RepID=A0A0M2NJX2_9FIRM|nr:DUF6034 family protein [Christensenella hongkongensis]KKI50742.1 hypothetical protein CHK_1668 [Christensenella hongkongensis]TCW30656.1 hypothetical protein EV208_102282 [Christensenella hongkongensis]
MRKRSCIILVVILAIFCLVGCQSTPDKQSVINKLEVETSEVPQETPLESLDSIETAEVEKAKYDVWKEEISTKDGVGKIEVDAEIQIPDVTQYPIVEVQPVVFDETFFDKAINCFFGDSIIYYDNTGEITKEECEKIIVESKAMQSQYKKENKMDAYANMQQIIEEFEALYNSVPLADEVPREEVDRTQIDLNSINVMCDIGGEIPARISVKNDISNKSCVFRFDQSDKAGYGNIQYQEETPRGVTITQNQAIEEADNILDTLGISDMEITDICVANKYNEAKMMMPDYMDSDEFLNESPQAYVLYYTRTYKGIPSTYTQSFYGTTVSEDGVYKPLWSPEKIVFIVNDSGIQVMEYINPVQIGQETNSNIEIMDIESVKDAFKNNIKNVIPPNSDVTVSINSIKLGMMYSAIANDDSQYIMKPVWDFMGQVVHNSTGDNVSGPAASQLTLDATNGSIVDRGLAY